MNWAGQDKQSFLFSNYATQAAFFCNSKTNPQLDSIIKRTENRVQMENLSSNPRMSPIDLHRFKKLDTNIRGFSIENLIGGDQDSS